MLLASDDPKTIAPMLREHFGYLADTPGYEEVVAGLADCAQRIEREDEVWRVVFKDGEEWEAVTLECGSEASHDELAGLPDYHQRLAAPHALLTAECGYDGCMLSTGFDYEDEQIPPSLRELQPEPICALVIGSNQMFYHPSWRGEHGIPLLCFSSGGYIESAYSIGAGAYILRWLATSLDVAVPELPRVKL